MKIITRIPCATLRSTALLSRYPLHLARKEFVTHAHRLFSRTSAGSRSSVVGISVSGLLLTGLSTFLLSHNEVHAEAPSSTSSTVVIEKNQVQVHVEETTKTPVPSSIKIDNESLSLLAYGVRQVTFLYISVYVASLYVNDAVKKTLATSSRWKSEFTTEKIGSGSGEGNWFISDLVRQPSHVLSMVISPVRATDGGHLRNGFIRMVTNRYNEEVKGGSLSKEEQDAFLASVKVFRTGFPSKNIKPGESIVLTKKGNTLTVTGNAGDDSLVVIDNEHLTTWLFEGYLFPKRTVSPSLFESFSENLTDLVGHGK